MPIVKHDSLKLVLDSGVDYEVRLTVFPNLLTCPPVAVAVLDLGVKTFALQQARDLGTSENFITLRDGIKVESIVGEVEKLGFEKFIIRRR